MDRGKFPIVICHCLVITLLILSPTLSSAQEKNEAAADSTIKENVPARGDIYFLGTPTIGYNPTYGLKFGAGAVINHYMGDPESTTLSSLITGISVTTKKQVIFTMQSTLYTADNELIFSGDWDYINASKPTYGLGTGPSSGVIANNNVIVDDRLFREPIDDEQMLFYRHWRFYETVSKKIGSNIYIGIGYHLDLFTNIEDHLLDTINDPSVVTSYFEYNQKHGFKQDRNIISGLSLNGTFDTRDNPNNPYSGQYASISWRVNPDFMGSNKNSSTLWLEYRKYFDLTKNHYNMLCLWSIANLTTTGTLPYNDLPAIGEDLYGRTGRGYTEGRFRGESLIYLETEYRRRLFGIRKNPDFFGAVAFANAVTASDRDSGTGLFKYINYAAGAGIRMMISKKSRTNLGLDYGIGNYGSSGFYLVVNETF